MSGIVGVWNWDAEPLAPAILDAMSARLAHRGADGEFRWPPANASTSDIGFAVQMLRSTPESLGEVQPFVHASGVVIVFDGRLDNREELLRGLSPMEGLSASAPDTAFILAAYLQKKENFLQELAGEFALALWDPATHTLFLGRDVMGGRPLYYCRAGDRFLFASEIKALLAHPAVEAVPNDLALAEYMYRYYEYTDESKTFFKNIQTLPPAHRLQVNPQRIVSHRVWEFDTFREIRFQTDEEYVAAYREQFLTAVKRRLRSAYPISIMASGGLDSSSIFCAAMQLKAGSPGSYPELFGVSAVPEAPFPNESEYQEEIEKHFGISLRKIPIRQTSALGDARQDIFFAEAPFAQWRDWKRLWQESSQQGARTVLSGFFGDQVLAYPAYMVDLATGLRWGTLRKHFHGFCRYHAWTPPAQHARNLVRLLKSYAIPAWLTPTYRTLRRQVTRTPGGLEWYSERFAAVAEQLRQRSYPPPDQGGTAHARGLFHLARSTVHVQRLTMDSLWESHYHLHTSYPFRDRDLMAFLMALPGEKVFLNGVPRGLHREAMRGILPEMIRNRIDKADFTAIGQQGAFRDLVEIEKTLPHSAAARMGYLKPPEDIRQELARMRRLLEGDAPAYLGWNIHDLIWLDTWLSVFFPEA